MKPMVLVVDDEPLQREIMQTILSGHGYETYTASSGAQALTLAGKLQPAVVLTDLKMAGMNGMELLDALTETAMPPAVIIVTAHGTIDSAVAAVKRGAFDYLTKPLAKEQLLLVVEKAVERMAILQENARLRQELFERFRIEGIVGRSPRMQEVIDLLKRVAGTAATVLITGESGTGKELVARAIHYNSPRRKRPFTAINCAAIPESLFESELFGHEPGAFTGAIGRREGLFESSSGGTLFLDEIGDLPMTMQSKLLRVLQDREVRRLGGKETIKIDVRLITATNKELDKELAKGNFREDLFYRLNVVPIALPPLRERPEDIPVLAQHFLEKYSGEFGQPVRGLRPEALQALLHYRWPGNVRQLESVLERAVLLCDAEMVGPRHLGPLLAPGRPEADALFELPEEGLDLEKLEKVLIQKALARANGVATRAARLLHMNYKAFLYRLEKFNIRGADSGKDG